MGSTFSRFCMHCCCCCFPVEEEDNDDEKQALLPPDPLEYFDREVQKRRDQETNLWSEPGDPSHSEREDDRCLYNLLQARGKTRMGSTGYRRLSVDIEAMRDTRREVRDKWKTILENLGFMAEADSLLTVSASASSDRMRNAPAARALAADAVLRDLGVRQKGGAAREIPLHPGLFVYCCDFSSTAVELVKANPDYDRERCFAFVHDMSDADAAFPVPDESLDVLVLIFVLSALHPDKMQASISRLARLLKPGGVLLLRDYGRYDMAQLRFKKGLCLSENFYVRGDGTRVYFFTQDELNEMFTAAGLEKVQNLVDRRLQVNRGKQLTMYRVWIQCKYRKARSPLSDTQGS
ncbi:unnamed protein product [Merluccius merluccius]